MSNDRASLGLDENQIDLQELVIKGEQSHKLTPDQQKIMEREGAKLGFVSRQPKKRRRVSPYTAQFGGKCREGMKTLFQDIGEHMGCYDTETLEKAIFALLEKENLYELQKRFKEITR